MNKFIIENNQSTVKKMYKLLGDLSKLNKSLTDEKSVQSEIQKYIDSIDSNLEMVE